MSLKEAKQKEELGENGEPATEAAPDESKLVSDIEKFMVEYMAGPAPSNPLNAIAARLDAMEQRLEAQHHEHVIRSIDGDLLGQICDRIKKIEGVVGVPLAAARGYSVDARLAKIEEHLKAQHGGSF
jgi:hypothetical protein